MGQSDSVRNDLVISFLRLRQLIGGLGIALPILVTALQPLIWIAGGRVGPYPTPKGSISEYYDSPVRDVFVGVLFALGTFLGSYRGHPDGKLKLLGREILGDNGLANFSAACAFLVALCPVTSDLTWIQYVHIAAAAGLFAAFAVLSAFQFTRGESRWNGVYRTCGALVALFLVLAALYELVPALQALTPYGLFYLETLMLLTFGVAWGIKGHALEDELEKPSALAPSEPDAPAPGGMDARFESVPPTVQKL